MNSREVILERLKRVASPEDLPTPWQSRREYGDLPQQFGQALTAAAGEVKYAPDFPAALEQVGALLTELVAQSIVVNPQGPLDSATLRDRWPDLAWHFVGESTTDLRQFCESAAVGIGVAEAAWAETGSVVITSGASNSRLATLLPPVHIVLVPTSKLTPDIFTWATTHPRQMAAKLLVISGPSKSADIESILTIGVHGPGRFVAIVYGD